MQLVIHLLVPFCHVVRVYLCVHVYLAGKLTALSTNMGSINLYTTFLEIQQAG